MLTTLTLAIIATIIFVELISTFVFINQYVLLVVEDTSQG